MLSQWINTAWMLSCLKEYNRFNQSTLSVRRTQELVLRQILQANRNCRFGIAFDFESIGAVEDFQGRVPLSEYQDYSSSIEAISKGEKGVITSDDVRLLEPTGGTGGGEKLIPYTSGLQQSFQRAINTWICDLYRKRPAARCGRAYWSLTPLAKESRTTSGGIRIGFDEDREYLGAVHRWMARRVMIAPSNLSRTDDAVLARKKTLCSLVQSSDLSLISVWSPTFLTELLYELWRDREAIAESLNRDVKGQRASKILSSSKDIQSLANELWPQLSLISCWTDGPSAAYARKLQSLVPDIEIQPKGLLATEAFISIPLIDRPAAALALRSNFYEFAPVGNSGKNGDRLLLADELQVGAQYSVIITTHGGLYRYRMHDVVEVVDFLNQCPLIRFIGRDNLVYDLVGEKLTESDLSDALAKALKRLKIDVDFADVIAKVGPPARYVCRIQTAKHVDENQCENLGREIEVSLLSHSGYRYARSLGQLVCIEIQQLSPLQADEIVRTRRDKLIAKGQREGDIKPRVVYTQD